MEQIKSKFVEVLDDETIVIRLTISFSQNTYWGRHWSQKHRERDQMALIVNAICKAIPKEILAERVAREMEVVSHNRKDLPNVIGGMKGFIDAMKTAGLLVDDNPKWLPSMKVSCQYPHPSDKTILTTILLRKVK